MLDGVTWFDMLARWRAVCKDDWTFVMRHVDQDEPDNDDSIDGRVFVYFERIKAAQEALLPKDIAIRE